MWPTVSIPTALLNLTLEYVILTRRRTPVAHVLVRLAHLILLGGGVLLLRRLPDPGSPIVTALRYAVSTSFLLPCIYLFAESVPQKVFLFFMNWGFTTFLSSFCVWVVNSVSNGLLSYALVAAMYLPIFIFVIPLYVKYWRNGIRRMLFLFELGNPAYVVLPIVSFVLFSALFGPVIAPGNIFEFLVMLLFEFLVLFTYYLLFSHFLVLYDRMRTLDDYRNAERQLTLQKRYYEEVEKGVRQQRKLIHDTRHHLTAIAALSASGDAAAIGPYVARLLDRYGRGTFKRYCANRVANAIISGYIEVAAARGIAVSTDIDLPQEIGMDEYELCALFGNAIENAVEACGRIPVNSELYGRRYISIKSKAEGGRLVVRIENTFKADGKTEEGTFPSSKGSFGGVGLESIRAVVDRYGGCLNCERMGAVFVLSAVLYPRAS